MTTLNAFDDPGRVFFPPRGERPSGWLTRGGKAEFGGQRMKGRTGRTRKDLSELKCEKGVTCFYILYGGRGVLGRVRIRRGCNAVYKENMGPHFDGASWIREGVGPTMRGDLRYVCHVHQLSFPTPLLEPLDREHIKRLSRPTSLLLKVKRKQG